MSLFETKDAISTVENTEELEKKHMEQTIDDLPIKDKEDLIGLINFWEEDGFDINYWSDQENEKKWRPIHNFISKNMYEYKSRLTRDVLVEKIKFANAYNNKKMIDFINDLLKREKKDSVIYPETKDKKQDKKYEYLGYFYNNKEALQWFKKICEQSIEQKGWKQEKTVQKAKQRSQVNDLKTALMA